MINSENKTIKPGDQLGEPLTGHTNIVRWNSKTGVNSSYLNNC